jgi:hypothetical protein
MASRAVKAEVPAKRSDRRAPERGPASARQATPARKAAAAPALVRPAAAASAVALTDEERIESAKYAESQPRPRYFEDERFVFPESYGRNRLRLRVKDPEWLFAHWDVAQATLAQMRRDLGVRAVAVSPLTLRVVDAGSGHFSVIFLPEGTRSWYVKTDARPRVYRAELGLTLPSGEFRRLAESNTLVAPGNAPSGEPAVRKAVYTRAGVRGLDAPAPAAAPKAAVRTALHGQVLPKQPGLFVPTPSGGRRATKGGASESFRPRRPR